MTLKLDKRDYERFIYGMTEKAKDALLLQVLQHEDKVLPYIKNCVREFKLAFTYPMGFDTSDVEVMNNDIIQDG